MLEIVPSIYTITIITYSHNYQESMKIYDLQDSLIMVSYYSPNYSELLQSWQDESRRYMNAITWAKNNDHDQSRRYSVDCSYVWAVTHYCLRIYCILLKLPLYNSRGIIHLDHVLLAMMEWMEIISAMISHPSIGMFGSLHLYPLHCELYL